ncbi:MAG: hypothetical protein KBG28_15030 [Kofleriaceae bacterium]|nr:hypothetical protein [Kofleriaceae bacterium]
MRGAPLLLVAVGLIGAIGCGRLDFATAGAGVAGEPDASGADAGAAGLVLWFPMDTAPAAGVGNETGAAGLDAYCEPDCPTQVAGPRGGAYQFDGQGDALAVMPTAALELDRGTLAAWVRVDEQRPDQAVALLQRPFDQLGRNSFEIFVADQGGLLEVHAGGDAATPGYVIVPWPALGTWIHVARQAGWPPS